MELDRSLFRGRRHGAASGRRRRGLTLLEILIVVGMIGVLASMLMPMVGKMREASRVTACQGNIRNIYLASLAFSNDNMGRLPRPPKTGDKAATTDPVIKKYNAWFHLGEGRMDFEHGNIWPYLAPTMEERKQIVNCPSDIDEQHHLGGVYHAEIVRDFTYSFSGRIIDEPGINGTLRLGEVVDAGRKIMIWEEIGPNDGYCLDPQVANRWDDQPTGRHGGGALNRSDNPSPSNRNRYRTAGRGCFGFFDGHTESITPADIFANPSYYKPVK